MRFPWLLNFLIAGAYALTFVLEARPNGSHSERSIDFSCSAKSFVSGFIKLPPLLSGVTVTGMIRDRRGELVWSKFGLVGDTSFAFKSASTSQRYRLTVRVQKTDRPSVVNTGVASDFGKEPIEVLVDTSVDINPDLFDQDLAKELKITPVEQEIIRLSGTFRKLYDDTQQLLKTVSLLRDANDLSLSRIRRFSAFSFFVPIACAGVQFLVMKRFWKKQKHTE